MNELRTIDPLGVDLFDDAIRSLMRPWRMDLPDAAPRIKLDLTEEDDHYAVKAEIPGVKKDDINVRVEGNLVTISAEVKHEKSSEGNGGRVLRRERQEGYASRSFTVACPLDDSKVEAAYKDGVLSLNKSKLDTAVAADPAILEKVFSNTATTTDARVKFLGATSKTLEGTYAINVSNAYNGSNTIAGTINGVAATGVSSTLSGAVGDASEGLQFSVAQDASGNMGSITFSKGLAERLSDWINTLSDEGGALSSRTDGLNSRKLRLDDQEDRLNLRLEQVEKRYRAQFSALDSMLASMQQTSSYLSQQLAALSR